MLTISAPAVIRAAKTLIANEAIAIRRGKRLKI